MTTAALVIGVNKTGGLATLSGAVSGAHDFASWASKQNFDVRLVTDEHEDVTLSILQDQIEHILAPRTCKKLIVYFAGHGFLLSSNLELWLLTKAPNRAQEAVNVRISADHARYSGLDHVIFVSDACRSGGPTHQHRTVTGAPIFPPPTTFDFNGKVDSFYATRPGDVALEFNDSAEAVSNYKGLFTECLLNALKGKSSEVVTIHDTDGNERWLIESENLNRHLANVVPIQAENISIKLSQNPIVIAESRLPQFFGELPSRPGSMRSGDTPSPPAAPSGAREMINTNRDSVLTMHSDDGLAIDNHSTDEERLFVNQLNRISAAQARDHFETSTGFTVYGNVKNVTISQNRDAEFFHENDAIQIRIGMNEDDLLSILIEFEEGFSTVLAPISGFIGVVVVEDQQVISVNYTPSSNTSLFHEEYEPLAERIEKRRAFAATAMRHGLFELPAEDARGVGNYLRMMKKLDKTLGIYAAYAYQQAGQLKHIRSVATYMVNDGILPFDVMLLARQYDKHQAFAPFCPMLRQGWGLLGLHPDKHQQLAPLQQGLLPSLWTIFNEPTSQIIKTQLLSGELK